MLQMAWWLKNWTYDQKVAGSIRGVAPLSKAPNTSVSSLVLVNVFDCMDWFKMKNNYS